MSALIHHRPVLIRAVEGLDAGRLRLFLLSLPLRAGATARSEFDSFPCPNLAWNGYSESWWVKNPTRPTFILQPLLSSRRAVPITQINPSSGFEELPDWEATRIRFYLDGLIAHVYEPASVDVRDYLGVFRVCAGQPLVVTATPFDGSLSDRDIATVVGIRSLAIQASPGESEAVERSTISRRAVAMLRFTNLSKAFLTPD